MEVVVDHHLRSGGSGDCSCHLVDTFKFVVVEREDHIGGSNQLGYIRRIARIAYYMLRARKKGKVLRRRVGRGHAGVEPLVAKHAAKPQG